MKGLGQKILDKKMFVRTSQGFGFAPVLTPNGWSLMMFSSSKNYEENRPVDDFIFQVDEFDSWRDYWELASYLKASVSRINFHVNRWMNPVVIKILSQEESQIKHLSRFD